MSEFPTYWFLARHVPDPFRDEPVNIGVVVGQRHLVCGRFAEVPQGVDAKSFIWWIGLVQQEIDLGTFRSNISKINLAGQLTLRVDGRGSLLPGLAPDQLDELGTCVDLLFERVVARAPASAGT